MLTNSLMAGAFGAAYLTILVLQLNPDVPLLSATTWWWFVTLGMLYGLLFAVAFYVAIVTREFFATGVLSPGWISVRLLAWLGAILSAGAATLMWLNVEGLAAALDPTAEWRMRAGAVATTVSAVVLLSIAVAHYSFGRRGSRVGASLFVLAVVASIALPLAARGRGAAPPGEPPVRAAAVPTLDRTGGSRVMLMMLDGASLEHIWPRALDGRLPNFSRILDDGAVLHLATTRPTQPNPVWAAVATGMMPSSNSIRSAARYYARRDRRGVDLLPDHSLSHALVHLGFVQSAPLADVKWRARPLWSILSEAEVSSGVVRWPLTHPASAVSGFLISDELHLAAASLVEFPRAVFPPSALPVVRRAIDAPPKLSFEPGTPESAALERDLLYARSGRALRGNRPPRFFAIRYEGLDTIGHYYFDEAHPDSSRPTADEDKRRVAQVVDQYYALVDGELGALLDSVAPGDLLVVVSGFGMQPMNPAKRALGRLLKTPDFSGTHERAPDGFMLAYGDAVQAGRPPRGSIVDVTPTLLYFFGLPVARDMDGYARTDLFTRGFTAERPVTFIPTYR